MAKHGKRYDTAKASINPEGNYAPLDAFRLLLIGPILGAVLNPANQSKKLALFTVPGTQHTVYLEHLVPSHFTNAWTVVAFALVTATVLKGIFDYLGTYLVNYAGFGMITDLRNDLYNAILRRSVGFFVAAIRLL